MNAELYIDIYYYVLFAVVIILQHKGGKSFAEDIPIINNKVASILLLLFVISHITFRPIDLRFGDTVQYALKFINMTEMPEISKDVGFAYFTYITSKFMNLTMYYGLIALIYVLPVFIVLKKRFPKHYFWPLIMFVTSFSFWGYGVNGLRNGMAASLVIASCFITKKMKIRLMLFALAITLHKSVLLPIIIFFVTKYIKNYKVYILLWVASVILSLTVGNFFENFFATLDLFGNDSRLEGYLISEGVYNERFSMIGFRWDFLLYSMLPILLGYYYLNNKKYSDELYIRLFNTYVGANAFWVILINAAYSNRFAYLSWFLMPIILIYPLVDKKIVANQSFKLTVLLLLNYMFTFVMYIKK